MFQAKCSCLDHVREVTVFCVLNHKTHLHTGCSGLNEEESDDDCEEIDSENFCDTCERGFSNADQLSRHQQEHRVCGIDGCTFVAHTKIVEKHIEMQHVTGLYYRIAKTDSPEDIAKWRAERKKRYPTKENVEKRQKEQEEMFKRGERIQPSKDRFGKKNKQDIADRKAKQLERKNRLLNKRNKFSSLGVIPAKRRKSLGKPESPPVSLINDKSDWNGGLPPFQGTLDIYEQEQQNDEFEFDDSEWIEQPTEAPKIEIKNALGLLIGAYGSSDDSDNEINIPATLQIHKHPVKTETKTEIIEDEVIDDEPPEEQKICRENLPHLPDEPKPENKTDNSKTKDRNGRQRKRIQPKDKIKQSTNNLSDTKTVTRRITLLERLLASEIKHERNVILQCVRFVVENNFFSNSNSSLSTTQEDVKKESADERNCEEICVNKQE